MNDFKRFMFLSSIIRKEMLFSNRTKIMIPILFLFIPGFAWGFADQNVVLPGNIQPDSAMEILFYTSIGILFSATIFAVLQAHDGISKDRISGVLEVRLSQPFNRTKQTSALIFGYWQSSFIPVFFCSLLAVIAVAIRRGLSPTFTEFSIFILAIAVLVLWYTLLALIASSFAHEQSTAITFGIGTWFLFTFLWALVTSMVAYASGVQIGQPNNPEWIRIEGYLDLLSPNGVFHHILETQLSEVQRGVSWLYIGASTILWCILPWWVLQRRIQHLTLV